eukprot:UN24429
MMATISPGAAKPLMDFNISLSPSLTQMLSHLTPIGVDASIVSTVDSTSNFGSCLAYFHSFRARLRNFNYLHSTCHRKQKKVKKASIAADWIGSNECQILV